MRRLLTAISGALLFALLGIATPAQAAEVSSTFTVSGWVCGGCTSRTQKELYDLEGVKDVQPDLDAGKLTVVYDDEQVSLDAIKEAVTKLKYKVSD